MTAREVQHQLLRGVKRIQAERKAHGAGGRLPVSTILSLNFRRKKNGSDGAEVFAWGKVTVGHVVRGNQFASLLRDRDKELLVFPNRDHARRRILHYPQRVALAEVGAVEVSL